MEEKSPSSLPRPLRIAAVALAAVTLFAFFLYLGFPFERLAPLLVSRVEQGTGVRLVVGTVEASPRLLGPGIALSNVRARFRDGRTLAFTGVHLRLAWSTAWFTARPAFAVEAESPSGSLSGVVTLGSSASFEGFLSEVDLEALDLESYAQGVSLEGSADIEASLSFGDSGAEGPIGLVARSGTLAHPALPMAIPYDEIHGDFLLGGDVAVRIESLAIESSLGKGTIAGSVGHAAAANAAPLDLEIEITAAPAVHAVLRSQGIRLDESGATKFRIAGTAGRPLVR